MHRRSLPAIAAVVLLSTAHPIAFADVSDQDFAALKARIAQLESQVNENWLTDQRADQIRGIVRDVLADAKNQRDQGSADAGYSNGFFIQSADKNFKLTIGGMLQARYEFAFHHADDAVFKTKPLAQGDNENASGFDIRRARINFTGNAFSPDLFYRFEGDFYASSTGGFTVTDAYVGYVFSPQFKVRAGAFKTPFTKSELVPDANLELERPEANFPFDPQRSLGVSLFGDIVKDKWTYELNANDGGKTNTFRYLDSTNNVTSITNATTSSYNLDNRLALYARTQYAGSGAVSDFFDGGESDMRTGKRDFIWLVGGAVGYESQNSSAATFAQSSQTIAGLGSNNAPGFIKAYALNGDLFRGTLDWSAKWQGWSLDTAAYFQQVNANPYAGSKTAGLPYNVNKASFFQHAYYAQLGYMVIPAKLEIVGRAGYLFDEGDPNVGQFYGLGANYYLFGNNVRITADVDYSPEAAYTDAATLQISNTSEVVLRMQLQLKF